jgi:hypothetical protein
MEAGFLCSRAAMLRDMVTVMHCINKLIRYWEGEELHSQSLTRVSELFSPIVNF